MKVVCKCGNEFSARPAHIKKGFGKFCSRECSFKWRNERPKKLKPYNITRVNPTAFIKGHKTWNKGLKGKTPPNYKGENVGYDALHDWVNRHKGKANKCEHCGKDHGRIEWANKSHEYKRDLNDWLSLCKPCHSTYDKGIGSIKKKFNLKGRNRL